MGFSRQEYWSGYPFPSPGHLLDPGIESRSPSLQADSLPLEPLGKPRDLICKPPNHRPASILCLKVPQITHGQNNALFPHQTHSALCLPASVNACPSFPGGPCRSHRILHSLPYANGNSVCSSFRTGLRSILSSLFSLSPP